MLPSLALTVRRIDEAAVCAGPGLIVRLAPVLASLQEQDRLLPQRRVLRVVSLFQSLQSLLHIREVRPVRRRAVANPPIRRVRARVPLPLIELRARQERL